MDWDEEGEASSARNDCGTFLRTLLIVFAVVGVVLLASDGFRKTVMHGGDSITSNSDGEASFSVADNGSTTTSYDYDPPQDSNPSSLDPSTTSPDDLRSPTTQPFMSEPESAINNSSPTEHGSTFEPGDWADVRCQEPSVHTRITLPNNETWCLDTSLIWRYNLTQGTSKRRTKQGIQRCLANKNIVMIGDSRTRYQYLALGIKLTHGVFPRCQETPHSVANRYCQQPKLAYEKQQPFFSESKFLQNLDSKELCFCSRTWGTPIASIRENRFFVSQTKYGPIRISYLSSFMNSCYLDLSFPPYNQGPLSCTAPNTCNRHNPSFNNVEIAFDNVVDCLRNFTLASKNPPVTHAFVTTGWEELDIGCGLVGVANETGVPTWMMQSPHKNGFNHLIPDIRPNQSCGVNIFDRDTMTAGLHQLFMDSVHVQTSVNEEFTHRLLNIVCPPPSLHSG